MALLYASDELVIATEVKRTTPTTAIREGREASRAVADDAKRLQTAKLDPLTLEPIEPQPRA